MTREEAAKLLDILKVFDAPDLSEAIRMAKEALREQEARSKGCEYCTDSKNIYEIKSPLHDSYNTDVYISRRNREG